MRVGMFTITGWSDEDHVHEAATEAVGAFDTDILPGVGDLLEWETHDDTGRVVFWTGVVTRRSFHVEAAEKRMACRLAVSLCDEDGNVYSDEEGG